MDNLHHILYTSFRAMVLIREIVRIQEIDILYIDPPALDHFQSHAIDAKFLVFDIVIVIEHSIPNEFHHLQVTLNFITNEETLDLFTFLFSKNNRYRSFS